MFKLIHKHLHCKGVFLEGYLIFSIRVEAVSDLIAHCCLLFYLFCPLILLFVQSRLISIISVLVSLIISHHNNNHNKRWLDHKKETQIKRKHIIIIHVTNCLLFVDRIPVTWLSSTVTLKANILWIDAFGSQQYLDQDDMIVSCHCDILLKDRAPSNHVENTLVILDFHM